jgi:hypothetical protein
MTSKSHRFGQGVIPTKQKAGNQTRLFIAVCMVILAVAAPVGIAVFA